MPSTKEQRKRYRTKYRDQINEKQREYRQTEKCKEYQKEYHKTYQRQNRKEQNMRSKTKARAEILFYLGSRCRICGDRRPRNLIAHHYNPVDKEKDLCHITSFKSAKAEADKCTLLCTACHIEVHSKLLLCPKPYKYGEQLTLF